MYSQVLNKTCPYARSPPNFPHSEMTAKGAPIGSNLLVRTDASPLAVICPESMPGAKITSYNATTRELPVFALPPVSPRSATSRYRNRWKEPLAVELPERDANRCILVRGRKPVFVLLCDAEELLHRLRSWRCGRPFGSNGRASSRKKL